MYLFKKNKYILQNKNRLVDIPFSGDKIDVFDERTCRRVFNMTFDPEMRFISMRLATITSHQKTLYILTDSGKVSKKLDIKKNIIEKVFKVKVKPLCF